MLKKILIASALLLSGSTIASTEITVEKANVSLDQSKTDSNTIWNNWFISVGAGAQLMSNENEKSISADRHSHTGSNLKDWVIPNTGVRFMHSGLSIKGTCRDQMFCSDFSKDIDLNNKGLDLMNLHADILYNASNLICGYNEKRIWKVIPHNVKYDNPLHKQYFIKRVNNELEESNTPINIKLDINGTFLGEQPNTMKGYSLSNNISATLRFLYSLPNSGWKDIMIPIHHDATWQEHCNHMIYLNQE